MNVGLIIEMTAGSAPERIGVGSRDGGTDYGTLLLRAQRLARILLDRGASRLGLVDLNSEAVPLCLFGAGLAGVPFAPLNYRLARPQLEAVLGRLAPATVVGPDHADIVGAVDGIDAITT